MFPMWKKASPRVPVHILKQKHLGIKPFSCSQCEKSFFSLACIQTYTRVYTGETPYTVTLCEKAFKQSSALGLHQNGHTGAKLIECTDCRKPISTLQHLNDHKKSHSWEKPLMCSQCEKSFSHRKSLSNHKIMLTETQEKITLVFSATIHFLAQKAWHATCWFIQKEN